MIRKLQRHEPTLGGMLCGSFLLHAGLFVLIGTLHFLPPPAVEAPVYYVDVVNLPVASPQAGVPAVAPAPAPPAPPAPSQSPAPSSLSLPKQPAAGTVPTLAVPVQSLPSASDVSAKEFAERMARIEREQEARHEAAALEALRKRLAAGKSGAAGVPKGSGSEAGSDYGAYVQSRLRDALAGTIAYQSSRPEAAVRLYIDRKGKLVRFVMEKSSKDKLFDDSVIRAINKAKASFPPPPGGSDFEKLYVFSPEEVGRK